MLTSLKLKGKRKTGVMENQNLWPLDLDTELLVFVHDMLLHRS